MKTNNNHSGKNFYAFTSAALALMLMVVASVALFNHDSTCLLYTSPSPRDRG